MTARKEDSPAAKRADAQKEAQKEADKDAAEAAVADPAPVEPADVAVAPEDTVIPVAPADANVVYRPHEQNKRLTSKDRMDRIEALLVELASPAAMLPGREYFLQKLLEAGAVEPAEGVGPEVR